MRTVSARKSCQIDEVAGGRAEPPRPWRLSALLLIVAAIVVVVAGCGSRSRTTAGAPQDPIALVTTTFPCPAPIEGEEADPTHGEGGDGSGCGAVSFRALRDSNLHYADRMPIIGSPAKAEAWQPVIQRALAPLTKADHQASQQEVEDVLQQTMPANTSIRVATNAVRTSGTAFGVQIDNACVTGSIDGQKLTVEVSGFVNDGGCLAVYGH